MARYLVTGATGFVGPHLCAALRAEGHDVRGTDRAAPHRAGAFAAPLHGASHAPVALELTDNGAVLALIENLKPDGIFHLAGLSSVAHSFTHPQEVLSTNLIAACNLLEAVRHAAPRARILIVGSAEEYGLVPIEAQPITEATAFRPASPYAVSKVAQEYLALQYHASYDLDIVLARSFNHSGPGQSDRFVLPSFARQIAEAEAGRREPLLRVGNLEARRDLLDVRDVVRAYALLMQRGESGEAYNICRGEAYRIRDLLDAMLALARLPLRVEPDPERRRASDLEVLRGDPAKLHRRTGWEPRFGVQRTVQDVLDDWRQRVAESATLP